MFFTTKPNARLHPLPKGRGLDGKIDKIQYHFSKYRKQRKKLGYHNK